MFEVSGGLRFWDVRGFWFSIKGFRGSLFRVRGLGHEVSGTRFAFFGFRGTGFLVLYSGFLRFGVSGTGFRGLGFQVLWFSRYGVSGSLLRVFEVRGFGYGVYCTRFAVRGSGGSVLRGSR